MHEVAKRLKAMISQTNASSTTNDDVPDQANKKPTSNSVENLSYEASSLKLDFDKMNTNKTESTESTKSTNKQMTNESISKNLSKVTSNIVENSSYELSSLMLDFHKMNTNKTESIKSANEQMIDKSISPKNLSKVVNEIVAFIYKIVNEGKDAELWKQLTLDYFSNNNINSKEIYNWLLNHQNDSDSIF